MANSAKAAPEMHPHDWLLLVILSILWGGSFFFVGVAVRELPPTTIVLVRVGLGALMLLPFVRLFGGALPRRPVDWLPCAGMGMLNNVIPFSLSTNRADLHHQRHGLSAQRHHAAFHGANPELCAFRNGNDRVRPVSTSLIYDIYPLTYQAHSRDCNGIWKGAYFDFAPPAEKVNGNMVFCGIFAIFARNSLNMDANFVLSAPD